MQANLALQQNQSAHHQLQQQQQSQLRQAFQAPLSPRLDFRKRKNSQVSYRSSKKKLSQINQNLIQLQQKFANFQNTLKQIKQASATDTDKIKNVIPVVNNVNKHDQSNDTYLTNQNSTVKKQESNKENQMSIRRPRVQRLGSVQNGKKQKIRIDNKIYQCKNIPISYFENVQTIFEIKAKQKKPKLKKKKSDLSPRHNIKLQSLAKSPRTHIPIPNQRTVSYFSPRSNQQQTLQNLFILSPNDKLNLNVNQNNNKNYETSQTPFSQFSQARTKQMRQCSRMMNNSNRVNRYCQCCSFEDSESCSPSPHKKENQYRISQRKRFVWTASQNYRRKLGEICEKQDQSRFQSELRDQFADSNDQFAQTNGHFRSHNQYQQRQDSARTKKIITRHGPLNRDQIKFSHNNLSGIKFKSKSSVHQRKLQHKEQQFIEIDLKCQEFEFQNAQPNKKTVDLKNQIVTKTEQNVNNRFQLKQMKSQDISLCNKQNQNVMAKLEHKSKVNSEQTFRIHKREKTVSKIVNDDQQFELRNCLSDQRNKQKAFIKKRSPTSQANTVKHVQMNKRQTENKNSLDFQQKISNKFEKKQQIQKVQIVKIQQNTKKVATNNCIVNENQFKKNKLSQVKQTKFAQCGNISSVCNQKQQKTTEISQSNNATKYVMHKKVIKNEQNQPKLRKNHSQQDSKANKPDKSNKVEQKQSTSKPKSITVVKKSNNYQNISSNSNVQLLARNSSPSVATTIKKQPVRKHYISKTSQKGLYKILQTQKQQQSQMQHNSTRQHNNAKQRDTVNVKQQKNEKSKINGSSLEYQYQYQQELGCIQEYVENVRGGFMRESQTTTQNQVITKQERISVLSNDCQNNNIVIRNVNDTQNSQINYINADKNIDIIKQTVKINPSEQKIIQQVKNVQKYKQNNTGIKTQINTQEKQKQSIKMSCLQEQKQQQSQQLLCIDDIIQVNDNYIVNQGCIKASLIKFNEQQQQQQQRQQQQKQQCQQQLNGMSQNIVDDKWNSQSEMQFNHEEVQNKMKKEYEIIDILVVSSEIQKNVKQIQQKLLNKIDCNFHLSESQELDKGQQKVNSIDLICQVELSSLNSNEKLSLKQNSQQLQRSQDFQNVQRIEKFKQIGNLKTTQENFNKNEKLVQIKNQTQSESYNSYNYISIRSVQSNSIRNSEQFPIINQEHFNDDRQKKQELSQNDGQKSMRQIKNTGTFMPVYKYNVDEVFEQNYQLVQQKHSQINNIQSIQDNNCTNINNVSTNEQLENKKILINNYQNQNQNKNKNIFDDAKIKTNTNQNINKSQKLKQQQYRQFQLIDVVQQIRNNQTQDKSFTNNKNKYFQFPNQTTNDENQCSNLPTINITSQASKDSQNFNQIVLQVKITHNSISKQNNQNCYENSLVKIDSNSSPEDCKRQISFSFSNAAQNSNSNSDKQNNSNNTKQLKMQEINNNLMKDLQIAQNISSKNQKQGINLQKQQNLQSISSTLQNKYNISKPVQNDNTSSLQIQQIMPSTKQNKHARFTESTIRREQMPKIKKTTSILENNHQECSTKQQGKTTVQQKLLQSSEFSKDQFPHLSVHRVWRQSFLSSAQSKQSKSIKEQKKQFKQQQSKSLKQQSKSSRSILHTVTITESPHLLTPVSTQQHLHSRQSKLSIDHQITSEFQVYYKPVQSQGYFDSQSKYQAQSHNSSSNNNNRPKRQSIFAPNNEHNQRMFKKGTDEQNQQQSKLMEFTNSQIMIQASKIKHNQKDTQDVHYLTESSMKQGEKVHQCVQMPNFAQQNSRIAINLTKQAHLRKFSESKHQTIPQTPNQQKLMKTSKQKSDKNITKIEKPQFQIQQIRVKDKKGIDIGIQFLNILDEHQQQSTPTLVSSIKLQVHCQSVEKFSQNILQQKQKNCQTSINQKDVKCIKKKNITHCQILRKQLTSLAEINLQNSQKQINLIIHNASSIDYSNAQKQLSDDNNKIVCPKNQNEEYNKSCVQNIIKQDYSKQIQISKFNLVFCSKTIDINQKMHTNKTQQVFSLMLTPTKQKHAQSNIIVEDSFPQQQHKVNFHKICDNFSKVGQNQNYIPYKSHIQQQYDKLDQSSLILQNKNDNYTAEIPIQSADIVRLIKTKEQFKNHILKVDERHTFNYKSCQSITHLTTLTKLAQHFGINSSDLLTRLFSPARFNKNLEYAWLYSKENHFSLYKIESNKNINVKQIIDFMYQQIINQSGNQKDYKDFRNYLQMITGCPMLKLDSSKWSKVKNIKKHINLYGFALDDKRQLYRIAGTEQIKDSNGCIKFVKVKKNGSKQTNIQWGVFFKMFQQPFLIGFHPEYFLRSYTIPAADSSFNSYILDLQLTPSQPWPQKLHCVLSLTPKAYDSSHLLSSSVTVYQQLSANKFKSIGSGDCSFLSMYLQKTSYLLVFQNCQSTDCVLNISSNVYMELSNGRWACDQDNVMSCDSGTNQKFVKCQEI